MGREATVAIWMQEGLRTRGRLQNCARDCVCASVRHFPALWGTEVASDTSATRVRVCQLEKQQIGKKVIPELPKGSLQKEMQIQYTVAKL